MTKKLKLIFGCLLFALMLFAALANVYTAQRQLTSTSTRGWEALKTDGKQVIYQVDSAGPASILQVGDEVIALKGEPPDAFPLLYIDECNVPAGTSYQLIIRRNGQPQELTLQTADHPRSDWFFNWGMRLANLLFLFTALTVFLLRPDDKQAWLLALMLGTFGGLFQGPDQLLTGTPLVLVTIARVIGIAFLPIFFHFFLIFPERGPILRRIPRLEFWLYLPFFLTTLPYFGLQRIGDRFEISAISAWFNRASLLEPIAVISAICYLLAGLIAMGLNYRAADISARRKLRVVLAGCTAGFLNLLLLLASELLGFEYSHPVFHDWLRQPLFFTLALVPISFAYAIIRHQVIPVSLIIRRSVRYLLVSRGSVVLGFLVVGLAVTVVLTTIFNYLRPSPIVNGIVSAMVGIAAWSIFRRLHKRYLAPIIDRHFFRQAYDAQQIIAELPESLRTTTSLPQLLGQVATKIQTALQTKNVMIFIRDQATGDFHSEYSCNYNHAIGKAVGDLRDNWLSQDSELIARLAGHKQPIELEPMDSFIDNQTFPADLWLQDLRAALLIPLSAKDNLLGIISLGPRLGDLPFSGEDKRLLMSVSGPTTFAIENARLIEQMVEEARRRQEIEVDHRRKTEELAYARELQRSMLPKRNLSLDRIEIIVQMRAATEVGGDYYDFIEMADGRVCIAVGDATGHGMAAGLVVGMVKMGLINALQRPSGHAGVHQLVEDLNHALKRSLSQRGMGMCLGAAILDFSTLRVEVISNGMPPPYHYRAAGGSLTPIATQAPPLGFLRQVSVRPVEIHLQLGDALIWLSDGFEERLDGVNEVWGSEQVSQALERICSEESCAESIARRMIEACDGAAGGRSNNDDMTIVVAKVR
jgi:phosphoserine phosphatase RsbU/P